MPVIPQKPISPEGGISERITIRLPRGCGPRIERMARQHGMTRSEYVRTVLLEVLNTESPQEVSAEAS
jgi:metal-responsive CopG/Arc/MetJ family transcriptional regulator